MVVAVSIKVMWVKVTYQKKATHIHPIHTIQAYLEHYTPLSLHQYFFARQSFAMKFSHQLKYNAVPEWAEHYVA
jgi:hypothetical protein